MARKKKLIALHGTGGSTKGAGIIGGFNELDDLEYKPDIISGISVTAALGVPFALGKGYESALITKNVTLDDFWKCKPVNDKGSFTFGAVVRLIQGLSLGDQSQLMNLMSHLVSPSEFEDYQKGDEFPTVITMAVDYNTGKRHFTNMKTVGSYEEFLLYSLASASIPVYAMPVEINGMKLYDGGVFDHTISHYIMENYSLSESITIYSRLEDEAALDTDATKEGVQAWEGKNFHMSALERTIELFNYSTSVSDAEKEARVAKTKRIKNLQIFMPKILTSLYDTDPVRLSMLHDATRDLTRMKYKEWRNE